MTNKAAPFAGSSHSPSKRFADEFYARCSAEWFKHDFTISDVRAAEFVQRTATQISNPKILNAIKATVVQVRSLNQKFEETNNSITILRNETIARETSM